MSFYYTWITLWGQSRHGNATSGEYSVYKDSNSYQLPDPYRKDGSSISPSVPNPSVISCLLTFFVFAIVLLLHICESSRSIVAEDLLAPDRAPEASVPRQEASRLFRLYAFWIKMRSPLRGRRGCRGEPLRVACSPWCKSPHINPANSRAMAVTTTERFLPFCSSRWNR